MSILSGRNGAVSYDASGGGSPLASLASINEFTLSLKTDYEEVSCFGDANKVYIPGLPDISGNLTGFWNSDNLLLVAASQATTPGFLALEPNTQEGSPSPTFSGPAYLDLDLNCTLAAPKITSNFRAAGSWDVPSVSPV